MRKYYLFAIKKEYTKVYEKNQFTLYKTLENLYKLKKDDIAFGLSLYNQICNKIEIDRIGNYLSTLSIKQNKNKYLIKFNDDKVLFKIYHSCIICKTIKNFPEVFINLNYYDKNLFVCDFENRDYFFLTKNGIKKTNLKYNYS